MIVEKVTGSGDELTQGQIQTDVTVASRVKFVNGSGSSAISQV